MDADELLFENARRLPRELFAVIDGGKFDDVTQSLAAHELSGLSLYLEGADSGAMAAAGQLVSLKDDGALRAVISLARSRDALVLWSWSQGKASLYRHLRTLNLIEIPRERRLDEDDSMYETVIFRHWDPSVLGSVLPTFDGAQLDRFFGSANGIAYDARESSGPTTRLRGSTPINVSRGMLRISAEQIDAISRARSEAMAVRVADYLKRTMPEVTGTMSPEALSEFTRRSTRQSSSMGMQSEGAHCRWAYLQLASNEKMLSSPGVKELFEKPDASISADKRVSLLMRGVIDQLSRGG